ncbi:hypothetical protein KR032_009440, partial [Drosophila birchii]
KTEDVVLHSNIQGVRSGYFWDPFLGSVIVDISGFVNHGALNKGNKMRASYMDVSVIIHTYTCRTIVYNYVAFIYVSNWI